MIFKCKMCGAAINVDENTGGVAECEYCGTTQTLPKSGDEQVLNQVNRANQLRQNGEFDRAIEIYERILGSVTDDSEIYWNLVLCKYGIEYVEDPLSHRRLATCHRTRFGSVLEDADYLSALKFADELQKEVYRQEAEYIDKVQKGIFEISNKEEPFDVFICYKESDNNKRTPDSVLAQELYYGLTNEGFRVFFARITLEGKLGTVYEPYIFAALNSAKVMVIIGTKPEYFNAVWVKNEWARFLDMMKNDKSKTIIPAYKDMDPYDLPDALSMFQAQDMSKLGFMQDLIRGIKKIAAPEKTEKKSVHSEANTSKRSSSSVENLLKRGNLALEDKEWEKANNFFELVLNEDMEEARAYFGKALADLRLTNKDELWGDMLEKLELNKNYKKACRFASGEYRDFLEGIVTDYNNKKNYDRAMEFLKAAANSSDGYYINQYLSNANELFSALGGYSDSAEKAKSCHDEIQYLKAMNKSQSDIIEAAKMFEAISGHKDSAKIAENLKKELDNNYNRDINSLESVGKYDINLLEKLSNNFEYYGDYRESKEKLKICGEKIYDLSVNVEPIYKNAADIINGSSENIEDYEKAKETLTGIKGYKNSEELIEECGKKITALKKKSEDMKLAAEKNRKKRIALIICGSAAAVVIAVIAVCFAMDNSRLSAGEVALSEGDYTTALEYYSKLLPFGIYYNSNYVPLSEAVELYESALESYNGYAYLDAMKSANEAYKKYSGLYIAAELFTQAQDALASYFKKQYDAGNYASALSGINGVEDIYLNEQMGIIRNSIEGIIDQRVSQANEQIENGNYDEAEAIANSIYEIDPNSSEPKKIIDSIADAEYINLGKQALMQGNVTEAENYANQVLATNSSSSAAKQLLEDAKSYETYKNYLETASDYWNSGRYDEAVTEYNKVSSSSTAGQAALNTYSTLAAYINNYNAYKNNPVTISDVDYRYMYTTGTHSGDFIDTTFTLKNNLIGADVQFDFVITNNGKETYKMYTLLAGQSKTVSERVDTYVYEDDRNSSSVKIVGDVYIIKETPYD